MLKLKQRRKKMRVKINRMMIGVSLLMMTFSLTTVTYAETCKKVPTCAELGYTETWCDTSSAKIAILKCPFDQSKWFCAAKPTCNAYDFVYSDFTCSRVRISGKTVIGISQGGTQFMINTTVNLRMDKSYQILNTPQNYNYGGCPKIGTVQTRPSTVSCATKTNYGPKFTEAGLTNPFTGTFWTGGGGLGGSAPNYYFTSEQYVNMSDCTQGTSQTASQQYKSICYGIFE